MNDFSAENNLILYCAQVDSKSDYINSIRNTNLDWHYIIEMVTRNKLKPLLYYKLIKKCPEIIPNEIKENLRDYFDLNTYKNLLMFGELLKILKLLESEGIFATTFKGPILSDLSYGNLALRDFDDLDIYVNQRDISKTKDLLYSIGYEPLFCIESRNEENFIKSQHHYPFLNNQKKINLEIHWKYTSMFFSFPKKTVSILESQYQELNVENHKIISLSQENLFIVLCIHNAGHRWKRLIWLSDLNGLVISHNIDWSLVLKRSRELGVMRILGINLFLIRKLFNCNIPQEFLEQIKKDKNVEYISNQIISKLFNKNQQQVKLFDEILISMKLRENKILGIKDAINGLTIPTANEWIKISLPPKLIFIYKFIRPFSLFKRYKL